MHIVVFKGGLANQLFQLCFYRRLEIEYGVNKVFADISSYKINKAHGGFKLDKHFTIKHTKHIPKDSIMIDERNYYSTIYVEEKNYVYDGYWQSECFFPDNIDFIRKIFEGFSLNKHIREILSKINKTESVAVHVRRGDYVDNFLHGNIVNFAYLSNAIGYINEIRKNLIFFVFSDDIKWCRENLSSLKVNIYYVAGNDKEPELDMYMMSKCKYNIISNSSFSWWAQKLNTNCEKIVISPKYWFNDEVLLDDLNNSGFIKIKNILTFKEKVLEPFFSIIISVFNMEKKIRRCLSSILNQTFSRLEIIVVDDGSTDNTYKVLSEYAEDDARLHIIRNTQNGSLLSSRIIGLKKATGKYILFLDGDDYYSLDACGALFDVLKNRAVDILGFSYIQEPSKIVIDNNINFNLDVVIKVLEGTYNHTVWNKCYSRKLVEKSLPMMKSFYCNMGEDIYFSVIFMALANTYEECNKVLIHYMTKGGISHSKFLCSEDAKKMADSYMSSYYYITDFLSHYKPAYLEYVNTSKKRNLRYLFNMVRKLKQPYIERLNMIKVIDEICCTDYYTMMDDEITRAVELYDFLNSGRIINRIRFIIVHGCRIVFGKAREKLMCK